MTPSVARQLETTLPQEALVEDYASSPHTEVRAHNKFGAGGVGINGHLRRVCVCAANTALSACTKRP
jgi:hypothetical protein